MSLWHAILLGAIQGLTEFLPISSDGHLVLADVLLDLPLTGRDALGFDILLHAGSLLAILLSYRLIWKNLIVNAFLGKRDAWKLIGLLIIATVPGVIAGLLFADAISELRSLRAAGLGFLVTALVLIVGERLGRRREQKEISLENIGVGRALLMGIAQAIAILPGVSRSGSTISTGRATGLARSGALDFSFLMALPIIGGAVAKTLVDALSGEVTFPIMSVSIAGLVTSFFVSILAITLLRILVVKRSLAVFAWYLLPLALIVLLMDIAG